MKRPALFGLLGAALSVAVVFALSTPIAQGGKPSGSAEGVPPCADIVDVSGTYNEQARAVKVQVMYADATCADLVYDVFVYANRGDDMPIAGQGQVGSGARQLDFFGSNGEGIKVRRDADGIVFVCAVTLDRSQTLDTWGYNRNFGCRGLRLKPRG